MKKRSNVISQKVPNTSITELKYTVLAEMPDKTVQKFMLEMINDLKEDSNR
jgi:hypothetical protein